MKLNGSDVKLEVVDHGNVDGRKFWNGWCYWYLHVCL